MIPIIGQNQPLQISVQIDISAPAIIIGQGIHFTKLDLTLAGARQLRDGLVQVVNALEAKSAPLTGDGSRHAGLDVYREQTG